MGWIVYVKNNKEGIDLLKIINQEPARTFSDVVESFEKARMFTNQSYMKKGKKIVRGHQKILRTLLQEAKPRPQQRRPISNPMDGYESMVHDIMNDDTQDEEEELQSPASRREELEKKAAAMQENRNKTRPPARVPKDEVPETYDSYSQEEAMDEYLKSLASAKGDD